jgi:hypothetical protein|tara:strand:- start:2438 stop:2563 length:126 start_codon:yes stop_codon:yes gene_type:complete
MNLDLFPMTGECQNLQSVKNVKRITDNATGKQSYLNELQNR